MSSPERAPAVRCDGLTRRYGERVALDAVSLTVAPGERLLLTGGNGAGKTTLLRVLATVLRPHAGEVAIDGHLLPRDARKVRPDIGYVGHEPLVYPVLTARENLELYAALYGVGSERIEQVLDLAGLGGRGADPAGELSRGLRQRLGLARAMLHSPSLLLLDEPTTGLDEDGRERLRGVLDAHRGACVIATHEPDWFTGLEHGRLLLAAGRAA
jgi:heme exporter protein A